MNYETIKADIENRNWLRYEAGLPKLDPANEILRSIRSENSKKYQAFYDKMYLEAHAIILAKAQEEYPDYQIDSFMRAVAFGTAVSTLIKEWYKNEP